MTPLGRKRLKVETKRRQKNIKRTVKARGKLCAQIKAETKIAVLDTRLLHKREKEFAATRVFPIHEFKEKDEVEAQIEVANKGLEAVADKLSTVSHRDGIKTKV